MPTKLLSIFLVFCSLLLSQSTTAEPESADRVTKVIRVHGDANTLAALSGHGSGAIVEGSNQLRVVVIKGKPSDVTEVEKTIHDLDSGRDAGRGGSDIELVIYLVSGSMEPVSGLTDGSTEQLAPVYKQLRAVFPYKSYQLLSTILMRSGQNSPSSTSGMLKSMQNTPDFTVPGSYNISYDAATTSADSSISLKKFKFEAKILYLTGPSGQKSKDGSVPYVSTSTSPQQTIIGVETNVDLREDQKVIVGTSNVETASATLFLIVTARQVQ